MENTIFVQLGVALGLGLLVGLQREWTPSKVAGIRSFALITVFGTICGWLAQDAGGWVIVAGIIALVALIAEVHALKVRHQDTGYGMTTELAALVMFAVGVALALKPMVPAIAIGGLVAVLLQWKETMHGVIKRLGEKEMRAITRMVLIALVILPILPNKAYDPYEVLNPFEIWLMVVLIVGISLGGYIAQKFLGNRVGSILSGVLGGIVSSTATTVSYARRTKKIPELANLAAVVILIATAIQFIRVMFEVALVAPEQMAAVFPPIIAVMLLVAAMGVGFFFLRGKAESEIPDQEDPSDLKAAIIFGLLYCFVLFAVAIARERFGEQGLYVVSAISGLTDMDAITLSTSRMMNRGEIEAAVGWRMILIGALANLVFKWIAIGFLGHRRLFLRMGLAVLIYTVISAIILVTGIPMP